MVRDQRFYLAVIIGVSALCIVILGGIAVLVLGAMEPDHACVDYAGDSGDGEWTEIDIERVEANVVDRINEDRVECGLEPVEPHEEIQAVARSHSQDMHDRGFNSHVNPSGENPLDRLAGIDVCQDGGGENIGWMDIHQQVQTSAPGTYDTRSTDGLTHAFVDWWRHSDDHRDNQLKSDWEYVGVGVILEEDHAKATMKFC